MISLDIYRLCNLGEWDTCAKLLKGNDELLEVLKLHMALKKGNHADMQKTAEILYANIQDTTNKFGSIVSLLSIYWRTKKLDDYEKLIRSAEDLLPNLNHEKHYDWITWFYIMKGTYYWFVGNLNEARMSHERSLEISEEYNDTFGICRAMINLGLIEIYRGNYKKARTFYYDCLEILKSSQSTFLGKILREQAMTNLAVIHNNLGEYLKAIDIFDTLISIFKEKDNSDKLSLIYNNKASSYYYLYDRENAILNANLSMELAEKNSNIRILIANNIFLGSLAYREGDFNTAVIHFNRALKLSQSIKDTMQTALILSNIAIIDIFKGQLKEAKDKYQQVSIIADTNQNIRDPEIVISSYYYLGYIAQLENDLNTTESLWLKVLDIRREQNKIDGLSSILNSLIMFYAEQENLDYANKYFEELILLAKSSEHYLVNKSLVLSKAIMMKNKDPDIAIELLEEFLTQEVEFRDGRIFNFTMLALFGLGELYTVKLLSNESSSYILDQLEMIISKIIQLSEDQKLITYLVDAYILQAKFKLLNLKITESSKILYHALSLAKEYNLENSRYHISQEIEEIVAGDSKWILWKNENININKRILYSKILLFFQARGSSRGSIPSF